MINTRRRFVKVDAVSGREIDNRRRPIRRLKSLAWSWDRFWSWVVFDLGKYIKKLFYLTKKLSEPILTNSKELTTRSVSTWSPCYLKMLFENYKLNKFK